jgi:hypothetical protein
VRSHEVAPRTLTKLGLILRTALGSRPPRCGSNLHCRSAYGYSRSPVARRRWRPRELLKSLEDPGNSGVAEGFVGATRKFHFGLC